MQTTQPHSEDIEETVAAAYSVARASTSDHGSASELAACHLEQVLLRGCSAHLVAALRGIANEFSPTPLRTSEPSAATAGHD